MSNYIVPAFILFVFIYAAIKKVNAYQSFTQGARDAIKLTVEILPFIATVLIAIQLFAASGLLNILCTLFEPIFRVLGIPAELGHFIILKPFSGSGSITLFNEIVVKYGADSYITRVAGVIAGSSETVFYISAVYFSKTKIKKLGCAVPVALLCCFAAAVIAAAVCRIM